MRVAENIDSLFQLPLSEFIGGRNAMARRAKADGDTEQAAFIKGLVKPSVSAWAVNQLFWRKRELIDSLVAAGTALSSAHAEALKGAGSSALNAATQGRRHAVAAAVAAAEHILGEAGHAAAAATLSKVRVSLETIANDPASVADTIGRLSTDLETRGFGALAQMAGLISQAPATRPPVARPALPGRPPTLEEAMAAVNRAAGRFTAESAVTPEPDPPAEDTARVAAQAAVEQAQAMFEFRQRKADEAMATREQARTRAHAAQAEQEESRRRLAKAERAVEETSAAARTANAAAEDALRKLSFAEATLIAARDALPTS